MPDARPANLVIRASAGTGKTFQLSNRFLRLAAAGEPLDAILATTFTRKGAGEILDRVLARLAEAACDEKHRSALAEQLGGVPFDHRRCVELLTEMLRGLHRLRTGTLDSFFIQIARSYSLELGQPPGWQIVDELVDERLRAEAIRILLSEQSTADAVRLMNLLTKGEATTSVCRQLASLIETLYDIYLEAPAPAWRSLPRHKKLEPQALEAAIVALEQVALPGDKNFAKSREDAVANARAARWNAILSKGIGKAVAQGENTYYRKTITPEVIEAYQPIVRHAKAAIVDQIANQTEATHHLLERFDAAYRRLKLDAHAMRFADVTRLLGAAALADRMNEIEYRLDGCVSHLLLDEFQDTNPVQWRVLRLFAERIFCPGSRGSFFCVGDVKQAIFGWRGGVAEIFDTLETDFPTLNRQPLNKSYRSSQTVIDTVNRVFENLSANTALQRYPEAVRRWAARFETHTTTHVNMPGYCRLLAAPAASADQSQGIVTQEFAAREIARLHREAPGRTIGVLVRRNETVARLIYWLRKQQVAASEEGGNPLADSPAVQVVLSLLRLADHPGDETARFHVAHTPLGEAVGLGDYADGAAAVRVAAKVRRRLMDDGYGPTLYAWTKALCSSCDARELSRLLQLVELAYGYETAATTRTDDFVRLVMQKRVEDPSSADVRVMTFHQSKGLQFDIVVLPELDYRLVGQPPQMVVSRPNPAAPITHVCRYVSKDDLVALPKEFEAMFSSYERQVVEESLCVLYVALTRAIHSLHMIVAPSKPNEKSLPSTAAGVLRVALAGGRLLEPEETAYEHGRSDWCRSAATAASAEAVPAAAPLEIKLAPPPRRATRNLETATPSRLEGGPRVHLSSRLRLEPSQSLDRGTLLHAWFEEIEWLDDGVPEDRVLREIAARLATADLDIAATIGCFRTALSQPAIRSLLERSACAEQWRKLKAKHDPVRYEVRREWPFVVRDGDTILNGQIDRLVVALDGSRALAAEVIDFKSDRLPANDPRAVAARIDLYRPQLEAYRRAAAASLRLPEDRVTSRIAFIEIGTVQTVQ